VSKEKKSAQVYLSGEVLNKVIEIQEQKKFPSLSYTVRYLLEQHLKNHPVGLNLGDET
jgi:hypothetical protein